MTSTDIPKRRHAAGADPAKRDQILDGALGIFLEKGFDAASMNDICRAAGVSKGTLYVYFDGKEDLFETLIEKERDRLFFGVERLLEGDKPLEDRLTRYGRQIVEIVCSEHVVRAQRIIIATAERMPELGAKFYDSGAERAHGALRRLFEREVAVGTLAIDDIPLAAHQFAELATSGIWRQRLFGKMGSVPSRAVVEHQVQSAVHVFLAAYSPRELKRTSHALTQSPEK